MLPGQLGQASGVAMVCSEGTFHLLAQETPSCLREGCMPSAHTSAMGSGVPPASPDHVPTAGAAFFAGVAVNKQL